MKSLPWKRMVVRQRWLRVATAAVVCLGVTPGFASLGGALGTVLEDQQQMRATISVKEAGEFSVHEMKTPNGVVVREYVSAAGRVFGVAWEGPFLPDFHQILGDRFTAYALAAKAQRDSHTGREPLNIRESNLFLQSAGHMRAFYGRAFDPELLPTGVSANVVR